MSNTGIAPYHQGGDITRETINQHQPSENCQNTTALGTSVNVQTLLHRDKKNETTTTNIIHRGDIGCIDWRSKEKFCVLWFCASNREQDLMAGKWTVSRKSQ
eukprot:5104573-Ditylum_brightwellii.AAC.1